MERQLTSSTYSAACRLFASLVFILMGPLDFRLLSATRRKIGILGNVRRRFLHFGSALILTLCVWGQVSELFDHWDNTFRTGNDIEYSTVIGVLVAGAVIAFAPVLANLIRCVSATHFRSHLPTFYDLVVVIPAGFIGHSPPLALRI